MFEPQAGKKVIEHEDPHEDVFQDHYSIYSPCPYNSPFPYSEMDIWGKFYLASIEKTCVSLEIHGKLSLPLNESDFILE